MGWGGAGAQAVRGERGPERKAGLDPVGKEFGFILSGQERQFLEGVKQGGGDVACYVLEG